MGDTASQQYAQSLREKLVGLGRVEQHRATIQWAKDNGCAIDMFGEFAKQKHLLLFQSGNECENWIDISANLVYKMNMLVHMGEDILRLFERIDLYNELFPDTALCFVGLHIAGVSNAYPVFTQPFVDGARFATETEINLYMQTRGFMPMGEDGVFSNGRIALRDIKPKNVLCSADGEAVFVVDADVERV